MIPNGARRRARNATVLVLCHDAFGGRGGIAKYNRDLLSALPTIEGIDHVLCLPRVPPPDPVGALPERVDMRLAATTGLPAYARELLRGIATVDRVALVVAGHINLLPFAWTAARIRRAPLAMPVHGIEAWQPTRRFLTDRLAAALDLALPVSDVTAERFLAWSGVPASRTRVLPNCVPLDAYGPAAPSPALIARYGLQTCRVVMSLGRMAANERNKGYDELLLIWPTLVARRPELRLILAGDGDDRPRLEAKARDLGIADSVIFPGYLDEAEKVDHLRLADVFVLCGRQEGFGIVLLEALACGVPVVGSCRDATREIVALAGQGEVADPDRPETIGTAIERALAGPVGRVPPALGRFGTDAFRTGLACALLPLLRRA